MGTASFAALLQRLPRQDVHKISKPKAVDRVGRPSLMCSAQLSNIVYQSEKSEQGERRVAIRCKEDSYLQYFQSAEREMRIDW